MRDEAGMAYCVTCHFYSHGTCRRRAPTGPIAAQWVGGWPGPAPQKILVCPWPEVREKDWCGEWQQLRLGGRRSGDVTVEAKSESGTSVESVDKRV